MHQFEARKDGELGEIFVYGDIGGGFDGITAKEFAEAVQGLGNVESINVRMNSFGGVAADGTAMFNVLKRHPAEVIVDVEGYAASAASAVAMAGDEIHMATGSLMMIHDAWGVAMGNASDMITYAEGLTRASAALCDIYSERTGVDADQIREWMAAERWFSADEALAAGFATEITQNLAIAAMGDPNRHNFRALPKPGELTPIDDEPDPPKWRRSAADARLKLTKARHGG